MPPPQQTDTRRLSLQATEGAVEVIVVADAVAVSTGLVSRTCSRRRRGFAKKTAKAMLAGEATRPVLDPASSNRSESDRVVFANLKTTDSRSGIRCRKRNNRLRVLTQELERVCASRKQNVHFSLPQSDRTEHLTRAGTGRG